MRLSGTSHFSFSVHCDTVKSGRRIYRIPAQSYGRGRKGRHSYRTWILLAGIIPTPAEKLQCTMEKSHHISSVVMLSTFSIPTWESRTL